jgi:hypothetical protein
MKKKITSLFILLLCAGMCFGQTPGQMFAVFHDQVKPSMNSAYRDALKKLKLTCEQQKSPFYWTTVAFDDNSYSHMIPVKGYADMDKNLMADLETKIGKEGLGGIFADFDKCVESATSYMITSVPSMSYLGPAPAGENFRDILFWYPMPGKDVEAEKIIQEWLKLYQSKNSPAGVLTFKSVFGTEPGYAFVSWAKDPIDMETKFKKHNELVGVEAGKLWEKTLAITRKYNHIRAWVASDLSNMPAVPVATSK